MKLATAINVLLLLFASKISMIQAGDEEPPNVYQVTAGFNVLRGQTPSEQHSNLRSRLFDLSENDIHLPGSNYKMYDEIKNINTSPSCHGTEQSAETKWATSSYSLTSQAEQSSDGFAQDVDVGAEVPVNGAKVSAETTIRNALVFGNSKSSSTSFSNKGDGYEYSFNAYKHWQLYGVEVDFDNISSWTDGFQEAYQGLQSDSSQTQILQFFEDYGTHGLATAKFGKECSSYVFMEGGSSLTSYSEFKSKSSEYEASYLWWTSSGSSSEETEQGQSNEYGFSYRIAGRVCEGQLKDTSSCGGVNGAQDLPVITGWTYKPIWEMNVPGLEPEVKTRLKAVFEEVLAESVTCANNYCNGNGACAPNLNIWDDVGSATNIELENLFDGSKCFCYDEFVGDSCAEGRPIKFSTPATPSNWINIWEGDVDNVTGNKPICGVVSEHSNKHEDRRFKFRSCEIDEPGETYGVQKGSQTTFKSWKDNSFHFRCDLDKVMTNLQSEHYNGAGDRRWTASCTHFQDTVVDESTCTFSSIFENDYDGFLDFTCGYGKVIAGMYSEHNDNKGDRRFKFRCCGLKFEKDSSTSAISKSGWTDYMNEWDGKLDVTATIGSKHAAFCGFSSYHNDNKQDRRFRFKYCAPGDTAALTPPTYTTHTTSTYRENSKIDCPTDSVVTNIVSNHKNNEGDRAWEMTCSNFDGWKTDICRWHPLLGASNNAFDFDCGTQHVLAGIESVYENKHKDRKFRFKCCRWTA